MSAKSCNIYLKKKEKEKEEEIPLNELLSSIIKGYLSNLSMIFSLQELQIQPWSSIIYSMRDPYSVIFSEQLKEILLSPWQLHKDYHNQGRLIENSHILEAFLSLLLQLLYHKTDLIVGPFKDRIENLEKELRYLLTVLGDISWMLNDSLQSSLRIPAYATPTTSILDSILILYSLVDDLEDLLKRKDDPIVDVKDQINLLYQELQLSHSSIKNMRSPQPSQIKELKEPLMRIGGIAHQAQYLITAFLVEDAPLWYVFNRLTDLNNRIQPIRTELQVVTQICQFGGLKVEKSFTAELSLHDKRVNDKVVGFEDKTTKILDQLVGGPGTESLQIISIIGMPGLGKTTLANKLYNHPLVNYTFDKLSWSVVSQTYKRQSLPTPTTKNLITTPLI